MNQEAKQESLVRKDQWSPHDLIAQVRTIQEVMRAVMKKDEHYGIIPGTGDKPTLLKPGAEKLCLLFRLKAGYEILPGSEASDSFIRFIIRCSLIHIPTGQVWGEGIGTCNSHEAKYRYRSTNTGQPVPKEYWETRDPAILGGPQFKARKVSGEGGPARWVIYEQIEHDNPMDFDNTIVKMAEKRALAAAVLNATAASDIFTQDLDDLRDNGVLDVTPARATPVSPAPAAGPGSQPEKGAGNSSSAPPSGAALGRGPEPGLPLDPKHPLRWWPGCVNQQGSYRPSFDKLQLAAETAGLTKEAIEAYALGNFKTKNGKPVNKMMYMSTENVEDLMADIREGMIPAQATPARAEDDIF